MDIKITPIKFQMIASILITQKEVLGFVVVAIIIKFFN